LLVSRELSVESRAEGVTSWFLRKAKHHLPVVTRLEMVCVRPELGAVGRCIWGEANVQSDSVYGKTPFRCKEVSLGGVAITP
jgi:hypothetical protein